ncbi:hypothetical protein AC249_AIPGENE11289 [Exaiptasia diaphana]|nr:hypothetical protein AC249_AIPGENE11289 [Exaiptasia diaphana]
MLKSASDEQTVNLLRSEDELRDDPTPFRLQSEALLQPVVTENPGTTVYPTENTVSGDIADSFSLFRDYLDKKLSSLKEDLKDEAISTTESVAKKFKETTEITFKYEGNKQQHRFNASLSEIVDTAKKALAKKKYRLADSSLDKLAKEIKKRNKLIRLADKSPAVWDLVNEYLSDELASGSEDEKKIRRAEQAAIKKKNLLKQRNRNFRPRSQPYTLTHQHPSNQTSSQPPQQPNQYSSAIPFTRSAQFSRGLTRRAGPNDICFACGLQGHWRVDCRKYSTKNTTTATNMNNRTVGVWHV